MARHPDRTWSSAEAVGNHGSGSYDRLAVTLR